MTGSGASTVAFVKETAFDSLPGTPTYYLPGRNPTIDNLSLQRALQRMRTPQNAEAVDSLAGNLEGAFGVSYAMSADTHEHVRDIVFNDSGTGFTSGHATTSSWYLGVEYLDSISTTATVERHLKACIPLEYQIQYQQQTNTIQESITFGYADEERNTTITPGSITGPTDGNDVPFHGATLDVSGATSRLQSATLQFSNISRFHRGASATAIDATLAAPETSLDMAAIYNRNDYLELAYGDSTGTSSTQDLMDNVSASLAFDVDGTPVATYTLPKVKPDTYDWQDLINGDNDLNDQVSYHVNGGVSIA